MADDPESTNDPEPEPRPETISDTPTEFRKLSKPERRRHRSGANLQTQQWSGVETGTEFGRQVGHRPRDIFYMKKEEITFYIRKMADWLIIIWKKISEDYYFFIWISDVHSDLTSKSSSDRESY